MAVPATQAFDVRLTLGSAVVLLVGGAVANTEALPVVAYPLAAATAAPLLLIRRAPLTALVAVVVGAAVCGAVFDPQFAAVAVVMVAMFYATRLADRRRAFIVGGLSSIAYVAAVYVADLDVEKTSLALRLALLLGALVAGDTARSRVALRAAALVEAEQEEQLREDRIRQQVADERLRIAQDVHDSVAHALVAINVRAGVASHLRGTQDPTAALDEIKVLSVEALRELRATLRLLRGGEEGAPVAPSVGLRSLPELAERVRGAGLSVSVSCDVALDAIPIEVDHASFRIVQESLTNVMRHAHAAHADVAIWRDGSSIALEVRDDGDAAATTASGHGIRGMGERAEAMGGRFVAGPVPGGGWTVRAWLPLV